MQPQPLHRIRRLLVANRGEVVSRIARTATLRGVEVVGVYTESDARARYLEDVQIAVALGDDRTTSPYLDIAAVLSAALESGADAVHPGYGFLAENAELARRVIAAGLTWVGPPPSAIDAMGGKIGAKQVAEAAGVPVLASVEVGDDVVAAASLVRETLTAPVLAKPSAGGGGKGMHRIDDLTDADELETVLRTARREALASFGDGTLFVERLLSGARHVEVQIMADEFGTVLHLGTRDCSVQRRHQKIIEEAPAPRLPDQLRHEICAAAVALARRIEYTGAGTVEFLVYDLDGATGQAPDHAGAFAFLEMNTRLQVEHPVTEQITGTDLVALQLDVAEHRPLPLTQADVTPRGHSIEVRLYAENPAADYLPSPGQVTVFDVGQVAGVRWELGVRAGSQVSVRYDPMIAKIVATGTDRDDARHRLVAALRALRVGGVRTNRDQLIQILEDDRFVSARVSTELLDRCPELRGAHVDERTLVVHALAATLYLVARDRSAAAVQRFAPAAWRNVRSQPAQRTLSIGDETITVRYVPAGDDRWTMWVADEQLAVRSFATVPDSVELQVGRVRHRLSVTPSGDELLVHSALGATTVRESAELTGEVGGPEGALVAPLPGVVVDVAVEPGATVTAGQTVVVIEAMKMEHRIKAPGDGTIVALDVQLGSVVADRQPLATFEPAKSAVAATTGARAGAPS